MPNDSLQDISKTTIQLLLDEPFYGHFSSQLLKKADGAVDSVGLGLQADMPVLRFNPGYWAALQSPRLKVGVLKHQLLHLALGHPFRRREYPQKAFFDIAADLVVNQYIQPDQLPEDALTLERLGHLHLPKGESVGFYYQKILEAAENGETGEWMPSPNDPNLQQHQDWPKDMPPGMRRLSEQAVEEALKQAAERSDPQRLAGSMPNHLLRRLLEQLRPKPAVDWRRMLRIFLGRGRRTYLRNTIRRPSKRYGTSPGVRVKSRQKILVGLDTSGSIRREELSAFFAEIDQIRRKAGAEVHIVECDAEIQRTYPYEGAFPQRLQGGGGTRFDPVIAMANGPFRPDALVYFTDGFAPPPEIRCRCPLIWVIAPDGIRPGEEHWQALPGQLVAMPKSSR